MQPAQNAVGSSGRANGVKMGASRDDNMAVYEADDEMMENGRCGVGSCRPGFMQIFADMRWFTGFYGFAGLMTTSLSMYVVSQVTTLERQFGLSSSQSGFLLAANDIGYLVSVIIISHFARRAHIPRVLSFLTFTVGVSAIICAIPHFKMMQYKDLFFTGIESADIRRNASGASGSMAAMQSRVPMCFPRNTPGNLNGSGVSVGLGANMSEDQSCEKQRLNTYDDIKSMAFSLIAFGMVVQGFGKAPRWPLASTYIDDNTPKTKTGYFLGVIACLGIFGPAIAFGLGGAFSRLYVTLQPTTLTPFDTRWVGAWWLGFIVFGIGDFVACVPVFFFPRQMKKLRKVANRTHTAAKTAYEELKDLPVALLRLATNPLYVVMLCAGCSLAISISGSLSFGPKYMEKHFRLLTWKANLIYGLGVIASAASGSLASGIIVGKLKLELRGCVITATLAHVVSTICTFVGPAFKCAQVELHGFKNDMMQSDDSTNGMTDSLSCSSHCGCTQSGFLPVCGSDGKTYFSPCFAGCNRPGPVLGMFGGCSCAGVNGTSTMGYCEGQCGVLIGYLIVSFFSAFVSTLAVVPTITTVIRSVQPKDKSIAMGVSAFFNTLIGWMIGPIIYGQLVDSTCILWSSKCGARGACLIYDLPDIRNKLHFVTGGLRSLTTLFTCIAIFIASYMARYKTIKITPDDEKSRGNAEIDRQRENGNDLGKNRISQEETWRLNITDKEMEDLKSSDI